MVDDDRQPRQMEQTLRHEASRYQDFYLAYTLVGVSYTLVNTLMMYPKSSDPQFFT